MKHRLLLPVILLLCSIYCSAQNGNTPKQSTPATGSKPANDEETVKELLERYKKYTIENDYKGMVSMIHPAIVEEIGEEEFIRQLKQAMNDELFTISMTDIRYEDISKVVKKDGEKFARAKANTNAIFKVKKAEVFDKICNGFKGLDEKTTCDASNQSVNTFIKSELYVVYSPDIKRWFILADTAPEAVEELIPEDIRKQLGIVLKED